MYCVAAAAAVSVCSDYAYELSSTESGKEGEGVCKRS